MLLTSNQTLSSKSVQTQSLGEIIQLGLSSLLALKDMMKYGRFKGKPLDAIPSDYLLVVGDILHKEGQALLSEARRRELESDSEAHQFDNIRVLRVTS